MTACRRPLQAGLWTAVIHAEKEMAEFTGLSPETPAAPSCTCMRFCSNCVSSGPLEVQEFINCTRVTEGWGQLHLQSYGEAITHARWWLSRAAAFGSLEGCPHLFFVAMINTMTESNLGEERLYFSLHFQIIVHHQRNSGQELKAETWSQELTKEDYCLLACSLWLSLS